MALQLVALPVLSATVEVRINAGLNDIEQEPSGVIKTGSPTLELRSGSTHIGLRFPGVSIPRGSMVTNAWIQFEAASSQSAAQVSRITAAGTDNAASFSTSSHYLSNLEKTPESMTWDMLAWIGGQSGPAQKTPSIASVIQEVISRPGWESGNAPAIVLEYFSGADRRQAISQ